MRKFSAAAAVLPLFLTLAVVPAQAVQITGKGIMLGLSLSRWSGEDIGRHDAWMSFALGGFLTFNIIDELSVQPELLFVQKGTKWPDNDLNLNFRLSYLELPILAKYSFAAGPSAKVFIFGGPALAFKVGATMRFEWQGELITDDIKGMKSLDLGLAFGAGGELPIGVNRLTLGLRYTLGLMNCYEVEGEALEAKNGALLIMAGIGF